MTKHQNHFQSNQFYYGASFKDQEGNFYFGGINGLTIFKPENIVRNNYIPPIYITDLKILGMTRSLWDSNFQLSSHQEDAVPRAMVGIFVL